MNASRVCEDVELNARAPFSVRFTESRASIILFEGVDVVAGGRDNSTCCRGRRTSRNLALNSSGIGGRVTICADRAARGKKDMPP